MSSSQASAASSSSVSVSSNHTEFVENESLLDLVVDSTSFDPEAERLLGLKAFMIWGFLTAAGWIYISPEWLPLFSVQILPF